MLALNVLVPGHCLAFTFLDSDKTCENLPDTTDYVTLDEIRSSVNTTSLPLAMSPY